MYSKKLLLKNGVHVITGCAIIMIYDLQLGFYLFLKLFSVNYYSNFYYLHDKTSDIYKWKHLIRLTDTGHIANFIFYFKPEYLPICHNVHFIICSGYYISKIFFGMKDNDDRKDSELISSLQVIHCEINHSIPYLIILFSNTKQSYSFNNKSLILTFIWTYTWLFFVYFPWRYFTKDSVYSVLDDSVPLNKKLILFFMFHILIYVANIFGYMVQQTSHKVETWLI